MGRLRTRYLFNYVLADFVRTAFMTEAFRITVKIMPDQICV